ncbi:uncharacterized protein LOC143617607 [Bidens hawaiensis]|uniref:uncharacterized protein LOC143617607 n=1 Tax=Bidens hawaiensis TaxID=980011 RepID=UPI00404B84BB
MREFFAYRCQDRVNVFSLPLNARRLFQQLLVDEYTMIESERLFYIRNQQKKLRCETYENLRSLKNQGKNVVSKIGQRVILPSSFTGSSRYMLQNYLDAMSLCKWYGYPDFFITITCNPKWPEVKRFLEDTTLKAEDRPDILCRIFKIKLDAMIKDLKDNAILGKVQGASNSFDHIDPLISAELPDKVEDPELYYLVKEFMIHGPCGIENMNCPCMVDGKCSKKFPKKFREFTSIDGEGYPVDKRMWEERKKGFSIGRIYSVSPSLGEAYYLRILLNKVKGPRTFDEIKTVNHVVYPTFRDACYAYGLLDDDNEYIEAISEASFTGSGSYLRSLFATILMSESISRPEIVWERTWNYFSYDILFHQRILLKNPGLVLNEQQLKNLTLFELEKFLLRNNSSLKRFSTMPFLDHESISSANNLLLSEELAYNKEILAQEFALLFSSLTDEHRLIYEEIITAVGKNKGGVFFVYGYGGTGKTFLWKTLSASIRSEGKIVLSVASSGIASLLLSGGRTAHSRFHIPIN